MERPKIGRVFLGGLVATAAMTAIMYAAPMIGLPKMDVADMLAKFISEKFNNPNLASLGGAWRVGMGVHLINGIILFPMFFALAVYPMLRGAPTLRGVLFGLALWFVAQAVVMPLLGLGNFSSGAPNQMKTVMGSLIGHIIYGGLLGAITGQAVAAGSRLRNIREDGDEAQPLGRVA